jgi:hypothetical protein
VATVSTPSDHPAPAPKPRPTPPAAPQPAPGSSRGARTVGSPGLTVAGVVVVVLVGSLVGLLIDAMTGTGLGWIFGLFFAAASAYGALKVRLADLAAGVIVPPLVFAVLVGMYFLVTGSGGLKTQVVDGAVALIDQGPQLWLGTGLALVIVLVRWRASRVTRR